MKKASQISLNLVALAISLSVFCSSAAAETLNCTPIHSAPMTITKQGVYCLQKKLKVNISTGSAIEIKANNVTIDLNGYTIVNVTKSSNNESYGIMSYDRAFTTVKNGIIRGFFTGVFAGGPSSVGPIPKVRGHVVEDMKVELCSSTGIYVDGSHQTVRNNSVTNIGPFCGHGECAAFGIIVYGTGKNNQVINNSIAHVRANGSGNANGIWVHDATDTFVVNNRISDTSVGIRFLANAKGKYRDNLTSGISGAAYIGGTNAGNNH